jgi:uncharacterized membrane protein YeiH
MHWMEILAVFSFAISGLAEAKRRLRWRHAA